MTPAFPSLSPAGERRQARLADARLFVVTDGRRDRGDLETLVAAVCGASADVVMLRDETATEDELRAASDVARRVCDRAGALFVVDALPGLACQVGADGVHLGQHDVHPDHARRVCGPDLLIGRSCHEPAHLVAAGDEDVDYLDVGPVFPDGAAAPGLDLVRAAVRDAPAPWFASGGVDGDRMADVLGAGARRVVVGRAVTRAPDPAAVCWDLRRALGRFPAA